jgi:hypothetical protein
VLVFLVGSCLFRFGPEMKKPARLVGERVGYSVLIVMVSRYRPAFGW